MLPSLMCDFPNFQVLPVFTVLIHKLPCCASEGWKSRHNLLTSISLDPGKVILEIYCCANLL